MASTGCFGVIESPANCISAECGEPGDASATCCSDPGTGGADTGSDNTGIETNSESAGPGFDDCTFSVILIILAASNPTPLELTAESKKAGGLVFQKNLSFIP